MLLRDICSEDLSPQTQHFKADRSPHTNGLCHWGSSLSSSTLQTEQVRSPVFQCRTCRISPDGLNKYWEIRR